MRIKPIKTEKDYQSVLKQIDKLYDAKPNTQQSDQLEVLVTLVEAYEEEHYKVDFPDPVSAIEYWMESRGLKREDLQPYLGSRARISEVLNRKRNLSLEMMRKLHEGLNIPAEVLLRRPHRRHQQYSYQRK
jgi:HTH-type transcriptional regulator/antitoxin HigA